MDSVEAHINQLTAESEKMYNSLFDKDAIIFFSDAIKVGIKEINNLISGLGGGLNTFTNIGAQLVNIFSSQLAVSIKRNLDNIEKIRNNIEALKVQKNFASGIINDNFSQKTFDQVQSQHILNKEQVSNAAIKEEAELAQKTLNLREGLSNEQFKELQALQGTLAIERTRIEYLEKYKQIALNILDAEDSSLKDFKERKNIEEAEYENQQRLLTNVESSFKFQQESVSMYKDESDTLKEQEMV